MKRYFPILLPLLLLGSCATHVKIPPGTYINKDGSQWKPSNTNPYVDHDVYQYNTNGKFKRIVHIVN